MSKKRKQQDKGKRPESRGKFVYSPDDVEGLIFEGGPRVPTPPKPDPEEKK